MKFILGYLLAAFFAIAVLTELPAAPPEAAASPTATTFAAKTDPAIPPKIPLRDFFKNPVSRGYDLSPDGTMLSFLQPWESRMNVFTRPTAGGEAKRVTSEKERDIRNYAWKGNKFLLYAMDDKGDENFHIKRVDLKGGEVKDLTPFPKVRSEIIDDLADISETDLLITLKAIERKFGRRAGGQRWSARVLDLDIVLWSGGAWSSRNLTIPHPQFRRRGFVLAPAQDIAAQWRDPRTGLTLRQLHHRLIRSKPRHA